MFRVWGFAFGLRPSTKTIDPNLLDCRVDGAFALLKMNQSERPPAMCDTYVHRSAS